MVLHLTTIDFTTEKTLKTSFSVNKNQKYRTMKKIYSLFCFAIVFLINSQLQAQAPQGIPYQAVARDNATGNVIANKAIAVKFEITTGSGGSINYAETFGVTTNGFGLFSLTMGQGTVVQGTFNNIPWAAGNKWLNVYIDTSGIGTFGAPVSQTQFMSVPYSLYATNAGTAATSTALGMLGSSQQTIFHDGTAWKATSTLMIDDPAQTVLINGTAKIHALRINNNYNLPLAAGSNGDVLTFGTGGATSWAPLPVPVNNNWLLTGNTGTTTAQNFLGTTDAVDLVFRTNNTEKMRILSNGKVGINNTAPIRMLDVQSGDEIVARFKGTAPRAVLEIQDVSLGSALKFSHNNTDSAYIGYDVFSKTFYIDNENMANGQILLKAREKVLVTTNELRVSRAGFTGNPATHTRAIIDGVLIADSLRINDSNNSHNGWILSNAGGGNAIWTNPGSLSGDNLGNHTMTTNLQTNGNWLSNGSGNNGVFIKPGGNVGIGTGTPSSALTVNGDVEIPAANDYKYSNPKTHYASIDPTAFVETNNSPTVSTIQYNGVLGDAVFFPGGTPGTAVSIAAPAHLPDGARITGVTMEYVDNEGSFDLTLTLYRSKINTSAASPTTDVLGTVVSSANSAQSKLQSASSPINTLNVVDNGTYTYRVGITFGTRNKGLNELSVSRVRITYTVQNAD